MSDRERSSPTLIETGLKNLIGGRDGNYPLISGINGKFNLVIVQRKHQIVNIQHTYIIHEKLKNKLINYYGFIAFFVEVLLFKMLYAFFIQQNNNI